MKTLIIVVVTMGSLCAQSPTKIDSSNANISKLVVPREAQPNLEIEKTKEKTVKKGAQKLSESTEENTSNSNSNNQISKEELSISDKKVVDESINADKPTEVVTEKIEGEVSTPENVEAPQPPKAIDLGYNVSMNLSASSGNIKGVNMIPNLGLNLRTSRFGINSGMLYNYSKVNGEKFNNDFQFQNDLKLFTGGRTITNPDGSVSPASRFSIDLITNFTSSFIRDIDRRYTTGLGIGYLLKDQPNGRLSLRLTPVFENTTFAQTQDFLSDGTSTNIKRKTWGPLMALNGNFLVGQQTGVLFNYGLYALPILNQDDDFRWGANATLAVPIINGIALQVSLIYTHEKVIVNDKEAGDLYLTFGFGFSGWK